MKINITSSIELTPALETYIESKLSPLGKFVKHFENGGETELRIDIGRANKSHNKGDVFMAVASINLAGKSVRAESYGEDMRKAIDQARDTLREEIEKYKAKLKPQRGGKE